MTPTEQADTDLTGAVDERMERLRELAALRTRTRKATRERLNRRRAHGLTKRHATKLARTERTDP